MPNITGKNIVACQPSATGIERFRAFNPASGQTLGPDFFTATDAEVNHACEAARSAGRLWAKESAERRALLLEAIASEIEALGDDLITRSNQETALPVVRLQGERGRTCAQLRMFANHVREGSWLRASIDRAQPERTPLPKPDLRRMCLPLGPVAVFGASNFPLAFSVAGGDTASALAAGCPVVVKAHEAHPGTSDLVGQAIAAAIRAVGAPEGLFSLLYGGPDVGRALVNHPAICAVGFTGSHRAGRALFDLAAARPRPIPVFAEMGSVNPIFALPGALAATGESLAQQYAASLTMGVGQFCTNPGVFVALKGADLESFLKHLKGNLESVGEGVMLTEGMCRNYRSATDKTAHRAGIETVFRPTGGKDTVLPTVFSTGAPLFLSEPSLREEVFGPAAMVVACDWMEEVHQVAEALEGQLTATILMSAEDTEEARSLLPILTSIAGRVIVNGFPTGVEVCPSMQHGGPYPATTDPRFTSVGTAAIDRFLRPVCFQSVPEDLLPTELRDGSGVPRREA